MQNFIKIPKRMLIFFLLAFYIFVPSIDSISCVDCVIPFQGKGLDANHCCSICFNTVEGVGTHNYKALFPSVPFLDKTPLISFLEPAFSINKPPQN